MHDFLQDEAMGANRALQMAEAKRLLGDGRNADDLYDDDDFFANLPKSGDDGAEQQRRSTVMNRFSLDSDSRGTIMQRISIPGPGIEEERKAVGSGSDGGSLVRNDSPRPSYHGPIEEERKTVASGDDGAPVVAPGGGAPLLAPGGAPQAPRTEYSREVDRIFRPAEWRTGRSDHIRGKYLRTFGERQAAIGGGVKGFFGALFGRGMRRANRIAEMRAFKTHQRNDQRQWRAAQRQALMDRGGMDWRPKGILTSQLANRGPIEDLGDFPREPGVVYDDQSARKAHRRFMGARKAFMDSQADEARNALNLGNALFGVQGENDAPQERSQVTDEERVMRRAYAHYDAQVGNQTLFEGGPKLKATLPDGMQVDAIDPKFVALKNANRRAGADMFEEEANPHQPRPRRVNAAGVEKRVRFKDGADDTIGLPVNDPTEDLTNKPMPTGVRFHPVPATRRTFRRFLETRLQTLEQDEKFQAADAAGRSAMAQKLIAGEEAKEKNYYEREEKGLATNMPGVLTSPRALDQEEYAYPIRARLQRTPDAQLEPMYRQQVAAAPGQLAPGVENPDVLAEAVLNRMDDREERESKFARRAMPTALLSNERQEMIKRSWADQGLRIDVNRPLPDQESHLAPGYFDKFLKVGRDEARARAQAMHAPVPPRQQSTEPRQQSMDMDSLIGEGSQEGESGLMEEELKGA